MGKKKELILIPIGGIGNRIHSLCSSIAFAKEYGLKLKVYWFKDWGMGADFNQLYSLNSSISDVEIIEGKTICDYIYDRPRKRNLWLTKPLHKVIFDYYINEKDVPTFDLATLIDWAQNRGSKRGYLVQYCNFFDHDSPQTMLSLSSEIEKRVSDKIAQLGDGKKIGLHIRRSDHLKAIEQSPLSLFIDKVKEEIENNPEAKFYLATDDQGVKAQFKELFPTKITTASSVAVRNSASGIIDAMVELYILSKMDKIYGSFNSTFSELASEIGGNELSVLKK